MYKVHAHKISCTQIWNFKKVKSCYIKFPEFAIPSLHLLPSCMLLQKAKSQKSVIDYEFKAQVDTVVLLQSAAVCTLEKDAMCLVSKASHLYLLPLTPGSRYSIQMLPINLEERYEERFHYQSNFCKTMVLCVNIFGWHLIRISFDFSHTT